MSNIICALSFSVWLISHSVIIFRSIHYDVNGIISFLSIAANMAQMVKNLPAMWETWAQSLGWDDPLEKGMATHSSILAWRILWTEAPGGLRSMELQRNWSSWAQRLEQCLAHSHHSINIWGWIIPRNGSQSEDFATHWYLKGCQNSFSNQQQNK